MPQREKIPPFGFEPTAGCLFNHGKKFYQLKTFFVNSNYDIFQQKVIEIHAFHKIAGQKAHMVELGKVEDMRFQQNGRGHVELAADVEEILQKV